MSFRKFSYFNSHDRRDMNSLYTAYINDKFYVVVTLCFSSCTMCLGIAQIYCSILVIDLEYVVRSESQLCRPLKKCLREKRPPRKYAS